MQFVPNVVYSAPPLPVGNLFYIEPASKKRDRLDQISSVVTFDSNTVYITTRDLLHTHVLWSLNEYNGNFFCGTDCQYKIPASYLIKDGILNVKVFILDVLDSQRSFTISATQTCTIKSCNFFVCWDYFTNFVCYSSSTQAIIGTLFAISGLSLLICLIMFTYWIYNKCSQKYFVYLKNDNALPMNTLCIFCIGCLPCVSASQSSELMFSFSIIHLVLLRIISFVMVSSIIMGIFLLIKYLSECNINSLRESVNINTFILLICVLTFAPAVSAQCTTTTILQSQIQDCSYISGNSSCTLKMNTILSLVHLGEKACVAIFSSNGDYIGAMNLTYELSVYDVSTSFVYYTLPWTGQACSHRECYGVSHCASGCPSNASVCQGVLSGECLNWPGYDTCGASCGCAGCGCIQCSDACLCSRYSLKPNGFAVGVAKINGVTAVPRVKIEFLINDTKTTSFLDVRQSTVHSNFTFSLIGTYSSFLPSFADMGFAWTQDGKGFLLPISTYKHAEYGKIGDLQSTNLAFSPTQNSFHIPSEQLIRTQYQDYALYNFPKSAVDSQILLQPGRDENILPKTLGGITWTSNVDKLMGLNPDPGAVEIAIQSVPLQFNFLTTSVCPKILSINITGCYACPQGFVLSVYAKSLCDSGAALVDSITSSSLSFYTKFVVLSKSPSIAYVYGSSLSRTISGELCLSYKTQKDCFPFQTVLNEPPLLTPDELSHIFGNVTIGKLGGFNSVLDWWDSLTGTAAIVKYALTILFGIGSIVVGILGVYASWKVYSQYKRNKQNKILFEYLNNEDSESFE